jgi:anti-sigma factor RsiW
MNHDYIEEHQIADRYVRGTLPPDEAERFEDHYLSCPQCLERLALAESMQRGFKRAASQDVAQQAATRQLALVAWLARLGRSRQLGVLTMALLVFAVAALPGGLALQRSATLGRELAETRRALVQERERTAANTSTAAGIEKLRSELEASRRNLAREQQERSRAAEQLAQARLPQTNVPILLLDAVRSSGPAEEPTHRLHRPPGNGWAVLALQIDPSQAASYQAVLRDARGREIWRGTGPYPNEVETLNLSFPASLLAPGDYTILVDGSRFTFRVLPEVR